MTLTAKTVETPAFIVNAARAMDNIAAFQAHCDAAGLALRPHIKTHKTLHFAKAQLAAGAKGITCQKLGEAEVMAAGGCGDILITFNILGEAKLRRLRALAERAVIRVVADNPAVVAGLSRAFADAPDAPLGERLMRALEAGRDAGGESCDTMRSAALRVTGEHGIDSMDLRVDISDGRAVDDLRALFAAYGDRSDVLRQVALAPDGVPVMRRLFDASIDRIAELGLEARFPTARRRADWTLRD